MALDFSNHKKTNIARIANFAKALFFSITSQPQVAYRHNCQLRHHCMQNLFKSNKANNIIPTNTNKKTTEY